MSDSDIDRMCVGIENHVEEDQETKPINVLDIVECKGLPKWKDELEDRDFQKIIAEYTRRYTAAVKNVTAAVELIGPAEARRMLQKNDRNRRYTHNTAKTYAEAIRRLEWDVNGETIIIAKGGRVLSGQHRLSAIYMSGIAVPMLIVRGVNEEVFTTIDQHRRRSLADVLGIKGEHNATILSAGIGWLWRFRLGIKRYFPSPSIDQACSILDDNPGMRDSLAYVTKSFVRGRHQPGIYTCLHYLFTEKHPNLVGPFFDRVMRGIGVSERSMEHMLRDRIDKMEVKTQMDQVEMAALVIKTWNLIVNGQTVKLIRWAKEEPFPEIL